MRGRSSGKTGPPVPGLTRVGGGAIRETFAPRLVYLGAAPPPCMYVCMYGDDTPL